MEKELIASLLITIFHISNSEYQDRIWIRNEGPEWDNFDETVCFFFDDANIILKDPKVYGLTNWQQKLLLEFHNKFEHFSVKYSHPDEFFFIYTDEWKQIMEMAREVLKAFN